MRSFYVFTTSLGGGALMTSACFEIEGGVRYASMIPNVTIKSLAQE